MTVVTNIMTELGVRVRAARAAAGLSLDELARRCGVSKGTLVGIEGGKGNPSVGVLVRLAAALGVSVADLLLEQKADDAPAVEFETAGGRVVWKGSKGGTARLVVGSQGPAMVELWEWEMFPGEKHRSAAHSEGTREVIVVRSGRLGLSAGRWKGELRKGRGALVDTGMPHAYWCEGEEPVRFQMYVSEWPER